MAKKPFHVEQFKRMVAITSRLEDAARKRVRYGHSEECSCRQLDISYCDCGYDDLAEAVDLIQREGFSQTKPCLPIRPRQGV